MKRYLGFALLLAGAALACSAQRGGARGSPSGRGSFSAGPSARFLGSGEAGFSRSGIASFSRSAPAGGRTVAPARRYGYANAYPAAPRPFSVPSTLRRPQPSFYSSAPPFPPGRPIDGRGPWDHRQHSGFFLADGYGYPGWIAPDYLSYCDPDFDDCYGGLGYYGEQSYNGPAQNYDSGQGYDVQTSSPAAGEAAPGDAAQPLPYLPQYAGPYAPSGQEAALSPQAHPDSETEDAVTLIFKDGRPPEQIRNYALTPTTVYVIRSGRRHDIPVSDLDLAATQRANQNAGVVFQLPTPAAR